MYQTASGATAHCRKPSFSTRVHVPSLMGHQNYDVCIAQQQLGHQRTSSYRPDVQLTPQTALHHRPCIPTGP